MFFVSVFFFSFLTLYTSCMFDANISPHRPHGSSRLSLIHQWTTSVRVCGNSILKLFLINLKLHHFHVVISTRVI
jgi:hypothetical protein